MNGCGVARRRMTGLLCVVVASGLAGGVAVSGIAAASPVIERTFRSGEVEVTSRYKAMEASDALDYAPRVLVMHRGRKVGEARFESGVGAPAVFIVRMDPSNALPEVIVESYSGGAHCCEEIIVFRAPEKAGGKRPWRKISLGVFDGGPRKPRDFDGDGLAEILVRDDAFYYAYGCYACSYAPPVVLSVRDGRKVDLTRLPSFRPLLREEERRVIRRMRESRAENGGRVENGLLAGYVALKALLGEGAEGWNYMLKHHVPEQQEFCPVPGGHGDCAVRPLKVSFPVSLAIMLKGGYIRPPGSLPSASGN